VVFIDDIKDSTLINVFVAQMRPRVSVLHSVMFSSSGEVKELSDVRQVIKMQEGTRYEGVPNLVEYMITKFYEYEGV
ncbi:LPS export ABC transporter permease LptF, partial [Vibrio parahaemolyticus]|nr:LPS export ABC transporter permease LptF [Vibrio parahaemolyticus]